MIKELDLFGYEPPKSDVVSLQTKVERAIRLIKSASKIASANGCPEIEVAFSGGKDSCVILELVKMSGVPYRAIYKNTTIDPVGNIRFCESNGCEIIRPKESFLELLGKNGYPNQFYRHCCSQLKEYKVLDYAIFGIRNAESRKRAERYKEPEQCREYSKTQKVKQYMPILDWSDDDVLQFVKAYNVRLHPLYYRKNGTIDIKKRLGCMGCPLAGNRKRIKNLKQTPKMVKLYIRGGQTYLNTHPDCEQNKVYQNAYEWFCRELFCKDEDDFKERFGGNNLFGDKIDCKQFLEDYFKIKFAD